MTDKPVATVAAISDLIDCALDGRLEAVLAERDTLRTQLDEARREVELWKSAAMRETAKTTEFADARDRHLDAALTDEGK